MQGKQGVEKKHIHKAAMQQKLLWQ